jgi:hypothetical protein
MLRALPKAIPNLEDTAFGIFPGVSTIGRVATRAQALARREDTPDRPDLTAPKTRFNGRISPHRRFIFGTLSLGGAG